MNDIRIRCVDGIEEADALEYMQKACLPADCLYPTDAGHWWIASDGTEQVGFAGLKKLPNGLGYLCRSGVMPAHRGLGLQVRMIRVRERKAKLLGIKELITDTNFNPASANSLIKCGFKTYLPENPWSFTTAIYWKKVIA